MQVRSDVPSPLESQLKEAHLALERCKKDLDKEVKKNQEYLLGFEEMSKQHEEEIEDMKTALVSDHKQMCLQYEETIEVLKQQGTEQREQFEEDLISLQTQCSESDQKVRELKATISKLQESPQAKVAHEEAERKLKLTEEKLSQAILSMENEKVRYGEQIAELKNSTQEYRQRLSDTTAELNSLKSECKSLKTEKNDLVQTVKSKTDEISTLSANLSKLESIIATEKSQFTEELSLESTAKDRAIADLSTLNALYLEKQAAFDQLSQQLTAATGHIQQLQEQIDELNNENEDLKEEIRKLNSGEAPGSFGELNSPIMKESDGPKQSDGELDFGMEFGDKHGFLSENVMGLDSEPRVDSEPPVPTGEESDRGQVFHKLQDLLSPYSGPQDDLVSTVSRLLDELDKMKKMKGGVVVPKLQLRGSMVAKESQTSNRVGTPTPDDSIRSGSSEHKSLSIPGTDQDTPRQKVLPELLKSRSSQVKTEEIYGLHNRIRNLERELVDEQKFHEYSDAQIKLLKEELAQREKHMQRAGEGGMDEHLKDVVMKLVTMVPKQ